MPHKRQQFFFHKFVTLVSLKSPVGRHRRMTHCEYPGVQVDHDDAGDVEGAQGGPDDEVRVVEGADELALGLDNTAWEK